jgi:hypothetical protein
MPDAADRRQYERVGMVRDGKVREPIGGRCLPCRTMNVSGGGALLCVRGGAGLPDGTRVQLAIDWSGRGMPVRLDDMVEATIVRHQVAWQGTAVLAVRFAKTATLARAA